MPLACSSEEEPPDEVSRLNKIKRDFYQNTRNRWDIEVERVGSKLRLGNPTKNLLSIRTVTNEYLIHDAPERKFLKCHDGEEWNCSHEAWCTGDLTRILMEICIKAHLTGP